MVALAETITLIDALAIVLSVVSLIITIVGFFASLKFYRDGVSLQKSANDALTKLEEKTAFIQNQVGGMFDKTLDAAIGKRVLLSENFADLNEQLEETKEKIIEESLKQIGAAGDKERARITDVVNSQINLIREKVETTQESAEEIIDEATEHIPFTGFIILRRLVKEGGLTTEEIIKDIEGPEATIRRLLRFLHKLGYVETQDGKYYASPKAKVIPVVITNN